jgi:hypothetical protein
VNTVKKVPYGISNFQNIIEEEYIYVDKTKYIEMLEDYAPYQFFIRPRRFGKSLFISMLENYYDIKKKDNFDKLFGKLYIGQNPTKEKNKYLVWKISFAGIDSGAGEDKLRNSFSYKVYSSAKEFIDKYRDLLEIREELKETLSAEMIVEYIRRITILKGYNVFLLIDEYDNFANELISGDKKIVYEGILHGEGFVKAFYKAVKDATNDNFKRLFMTGVSPIMLDDLTSGFNITENLTREEKLNSVFGFTEEELLFIIRQLDPTILDNKELLNIIKVYYDGYRFDNYSEQVYNPDMTIYFLNKYTRYNRMPEEMIDLNVKTDYGKINQLAMNFKDDSIIFDIMNKGEITTRLVEKFNISSMYDNNENFKSLLFYLGLLTIKSINANMVTLCIPNYVIKSIYWQEFFNLWNKDIKIEGSSVAQGISDMRSKGSIDNFIKEFKVIISNLSNRDLIKLDEKYIKMILITLLAIDNTYLIMSEFENNNGYADMMLKTKKQFKDYTKYEWLIELKYIKESERHTLESVKTNGLMQINRYLESKIITEGMEKAYLKHALIIVISKGEVLTFY